MNETITDSELTLHKNLLYIKYICIENLFGYFTYLLPEDESHSSLDKLMILYGDNGSGKTTILRLIFNLLSEKNDSGHRTFLAKTKFNRIVVRLSDHVEIGAYRPNNIISGSYFYYAKVGEKNLEVHVTTDADCNVKVRDDEKKSRQLNKILDLIKSLNLSLYFLSDDRKSMSNSGSYFDSYSGESFDFKIIDHYEISRVANKAIRDKLRREKDQEIVNIEASLATLTQWIRDKTIYYSNIGETSNQSIYTDLITSVSNSTQNKSSKSKEYLIQTIDSLAKRSQEYSDFGLISSFDYKKIFDSIESVDDYETINFINNILDPFIEGSNAKLGALESIKNIINTFVNSVNSYFSNKIISFNLNSGFSLKYVNGDDLPPNFLSSGEKQLLLLFINTITATDDATIFIIDEPEISLNIKWQRTLLKTLLSFSRNSPVQFIIATHSVELLTSNSKRVLKLTNRKVSLDAK
ncbi:AAA family ATPase [Dyadobacter sp. CY343]|uniref:AAA family ATPase n=1 Tax=Dyadobacter sp. CY343 TaxID=2907299 RepID=UPI001F2DB4E8|nr:AAA family ATPase [Dyadobacter sp. CY343]MCE7059209.1 ATP-binding protein [Dyadobacter sp. CY343]